jgi:hypothetical protein
MPRQVQAHVINGTVAFAATAYHSFAFAQSLLWCVGAVGLLVEQDVGG